jgi:hypothetical protein
MPLDKVAGVHRVPRPPRIGGWPAHKGNRIKASGGSNDENAKPLGPKRLDAKRLGAKRLVVKRFGPVFVCWSDVLDSGWAGQGFHLALGNIH